MHKGAQLCFSFNVFVPNWGRRLALSFCHVIQHKTPPHSFSLLELQFMLRDMKAAFTLSRSVEDGTQTQEINPQWQSVIHHFHHFSCGEKKDRRKKRKRHCIRSTLTSSLPLLMSSLVAADRLLCGINRIFLLIQIWQTSAIGQYSAIVNMHRTAGNSRNTLLLWIVLAKRIAEHGNLSSPVNNSQMPAKMCSIKNILSH